MKKFSTLTKEEKINLGHALGDRLLGTADFADDMALVILESRDIEPDVDPMMDSDFCYAVDDRAVTCASCDWYVPPDDLNEFDNCSGCADEEQYD